ncbi:hypothetical protein [Brevundimonas sp. SPF441]|uniref:hypothetical protein n=1 Tax=Brevundimonas sp. SPF441 TaxID=2663795 RepID=UPI00129E88C0|nr:hypothetical protein [Brevundimonas sp. SPF441]MRL69919.1 hypothetical protein [Brevundimonas sp. SPF441]
MIAALAFLRSIPRMLSPTGWLIVAIIAAFVLTGAYCSHRGAQGERDRQAAQTQKTEAKATSARETAAVEASVETPIINAREKDFSDAVNSLPDAVPSARRVRLACERLRHQGAAERFLPEPCRSGG